MVVNHAGPLGGRRGLVHEHDFASVRLVLVHGTRKVPDELLEAVHLERRAHNDKHVRLLGQVCCLDGADFVAERVWFVVQNNGGAERTDFEWTSAASDACFSWKGTSVSDLEEQLETYSALDSQGNQVGLPPGRI